MWNRPRLAVAKLLRIAAMVVAGAFTATATVPTGWYMAGSKPAEYESGVDAEALRAGHPSAYLKAKSAEVDGFGTLMQDYRVNQYGARECGSARP